MNDKEKIKILRKALIGLIGAESKEDLDEMEYVIRTDVNAPDMDKAVAINGIDALRQTIS